MCISTWNRRIAITGSCPALVMAIGAPIASAQQAPAPTP